MTNDAKIVFDTIGKLAGLTVIYDPDFPARRIPVELNNVTLEQALEIVSLESKAFVKPVDGKYYFCDSGSTGEAPRLRRKRCAYLLPVQHRAKRRT